MSKIRKMQTAAGGPLFPWLKLDDEWVNNWKFRTTPAARSKVLFGKGVETDKQYTERRKKETTKRTWRSDAADFAHSTWETALAFHPYTAIPYFGAKVGLDFLNGTYGWHTALNASVPLFHMAPQAVGLKEATNVALEDAANAGSKTARNWRVAREINLTTKNKPNIEVPNPIEYNISDNITLYRANPTNIKNLSYKGERYGDTSGLYVGKWFTDESSKPNWYASNMAKRGEEPAYYLVTVPKYWAEKQKASHKISNPNIEYEPEDYIIEDGINGLQGLLYQGRPGTIQYLLLNFLSPAIKEPSTSLKFFERKPSKVSDAEKAGVPKGERNFKPKWHVANYPGYLLKGLMKGSLLEKQLSKNGTININLLNAYFNKASQIEKEVANKVLAEKFAGQKTIDYNLFKKAVLDELITYNRKPLTKYSDYGADRLGLDSYNLPANFTDYFKLLQETFPDRFVKEGNVGLFDKKLLTSVNPWNIHDYDILFKGIRGRVNMNTFTFESPRIPAGSAKHYDTSTLGHSRTYITPDEPKVLHVMESLSDWAQQAFKGKQKPVLMNQVVYNEQTGNFENPNPIEYTKYSPLEEYLIKNYLQRQLQENLKYAAENGLTKMRYPTSETAAKIEGYSKTEQTPEFKEALAELERLQHLKTTNQMSRAERVLGIRLAVENDRLTSIPDEINIETGETKYYTPEERARLIRDAENKLADILILLRDFMYSPLHQTILKKYADFPKLFLKLFKDLQVRTVTDTKGNSWYEVDVPKGYLSREWQFKQGGKMNILEFLKNGSGIHIKKKNRGKFREYCGGEVTDSCIKRAKASGNPTLVKRATFAANARKWKHKNGGKAFVEGVNVLDSNPKAYKKVKKKFKKHLEGGKVDWGQIAGGVLNGIYNISSTILQNKAIDASILAMRLLAKVDKEKLFNLYYKKLLGELKDNSLIVNMARAYQLANLMDYSNDTSSKELELLNLKDENTSLLINSIGGIAGSILNSGIFNKPSSTNFNTDSWSKVKKDLAGTSYIKPDTNNKLFTSNTIGSNMNVTYDDMRNLIMQ